MRASQSDPTHFFFIYLPITESTIIKWKWKAVTEFLQTFIDSANNSFTQPFRSNVARLSVEEA